MNDPTGSDVERTGCWAALESASAVAACPLQLNPSDQPQLQQSGDNAATALGEGSG